MKGRKPKPSNLRRLRGNPGRRPLRKDEPDPERGIPQAPPWLSGVALGYWRELAPELDELGILTVADGHALALLCSAYADWRAACEAIETHGMTYERVTAAGSVSIARRPEVAMRADAFRRMTSMLVEFGLTPSSRPRVSATGKPSQGKLARFLEGE